MSTDRDSLLVLSQSYPPEMGGNASRIGDLTKYLDDDGWDVTAVVPHPSFPHGEYDREWSRQTVDSYDGVTVYRLWTWQPTRSNPAVWSRLAFYILFALHALLWVVTSDETFDAVVTSSPPIFTAAPGYAASVRWGCPWVIDVRDLWIDAATDLDIIPDSGLAATFARRFQRIAFGLSDRLFVTTPEMQSLLLDRNADLDADDIHVIPNGVDTTRFDEKDAVPDTVADRERLVGVYIGNLGHAQNLSVLLHALTHADADVEIRFVGDGDTRSDLERLAQELDVEKSIQFTGVVQREQVGTHLAEASVGLAPIQDTEGLQYAMPTKIYEYLAAGVPVVATGDGAIETFLNGIDGGVVVENDAVAVAEALDDVADHPGKWASLARSGRDVITERYDRRVIANDASKYIGRLVTAAQREESPVRVVR